MLYNEGECGHVYSASHEHKGLGSRGSKDEEMKRCSRYRLFLLHFGICSDINCIISW